MATESDAVQRLIDQLARDRQAFIESTNKTHELLQQTLLSLRLLINQQQNVSRVKDEQPLTPQVAPSLPFLQPSFQMGRRESIIAVPPTITKASQRTTTADIEVESMPNDKPISLYSVESDFESEDNESIFVQTALESEEFEMDGLRAHIQEHEWNEAGKVIIDDLNKDQFALGRECLFPAHSIEAEADRSHLSHYSIYDIGFDGVPLDIKSAGRKPPTMALEIWEKIRSTNANPSKRPAAGRIVIVREPSPKLFAALHYTMNRHFDMNEIFDLLKQEGPGLMFPHRAFDRDTRHRRSFVITMKYFTIVGEQCRPMRWQRSGAEETDRSENHVSISRCCSVIALSLEGPPMSKVKNLDRRIHDKYGDVFDPFSPWRVLSIQAYPDWHATTDTHKPTMHYVNGPEAFLHTLQAEFSDARKRLKEVYSRVGELVEPPSNFIFNSKVREALLFEDDNFTYSKKYFWAYQTLSIINQDITEMIESYHDTFRESVWEGSNKIIWPGESSTSSRYQQWRKRMAKLRQQMEDEVDKLEWIKTMNFKKMEDIEALRENLFSGTSVMESRRSVEQTLVTIEQNRSVLLLTLVTIFFLPLTFVTGVFGMTNMNPDESHLDFAWTTLAVCVPTYLLIGTLHTERGSAFVRRYKNFIFAKIGNWLVRLFLLFGYVPAWAKEPEAPEGLATSGRPHHKRISSATRLAMNERLRQTLIDRSPSLARFSTRERYVPRPQPTSGSAAEAAEVTPPKKTKSNEVTFAMDRAEQVQRLPTHEENESESVSPGARTPNRVDDDMDDNSEKIEEKVDIDTNQRKNHGILNRFWRKQEAHEDGARNTDTCPGV